MDLQTIPSRTRLNGPNLPAITTVQGTPYNHDSNSRSQHNNANNTTAEPQRVRTDYDDYICEDLSKHRIYISFEDGLETLLHVPEKWRSGGHEYSSIIANIRQDTKYNEYRNAYLATCNEVGAIEYSLYEPQLEAMLYDHTISLINQFCDFDNKKCEDSLLHFQKNHPNFAGLNPVLTTKFEPLKDIKTLAWPMIVHIEETKDSDVALDRGLDGPRARKPGEKDPISEHRAPSRKVAKAPTDEADEVVSNKKRKSESIGFTPNKVPRTLGTRTTSSSTNTRSNAPLHENQKTAGARLQCARYLMEMLELSILRSHAYLALVDRDHLQLMYADRSAIVTTGIIDFTTTEGEAMFLAMLIAFHRFTPEQWGFLPLVNNAFSLEPSGDIAYHRDKDSSTVKRDCLKNLTLSLQKKSRKIPLRLTLQEILYHQTGIIGRGTCVIGASCEDVKEWEKWELAVKVSWPSKTRRSEIKLLERAREKAQELLEARMSRYAALQAQIEDLRKCGNFDEAEAISEEAKDLVEESKTHWALNHLPNILYSEDFDLDSEKKPMPQEKLALFLATADIINGAFKYEPRVLRVSVQEKLHRFTTLPTLLDYAQAFLDVFICHRWLYDCPRILHRDISSGNIMYRIIEGKIYGVLNDLDLSSLRESVEQGVQTSLQRTGTPPYMAIELLQDDCDDPHPILHLYRHDLESLAYVLLLLCSRNKFNPEIRSIERLQQSPFDNWFDPALSWNGLAESKRNYLQGRLSISTKVHPSFQDFIPWIQSLLFAFADGFEAKRKWEKNTERFGGLLKEGPSTKWEAGSLLNRTLRGRGPVTKKVQKPAPFKEETLGGQVVYLSLLRSLSNFAGNPLVYRDFDIREENSADGDLLYS